MTDDVVAWATGQALAATPPATAVLRAGAAKAVAPRHRRRLTLVEAGDASLALTTAGLVVTAILVWRHRLN